MLDSGINPIPEEFIPYSDYSGVTYRKDLDKWSAYISILQLKENNIDIDERVVVGTYDTEEEAIQAHKKALEDLKLGNKIVTPRQASKKIAYHGVKLQKNGKYKAEIYHNGDHSLGVFSTPEEAAQKYDIALVKVGSDLSKLNFPDNLQAYRKQISEGYNPIPEKRSKSSKHRGVSFNKEKKKWEAYITDPVTKKRIRLGYFDSEESAAYAISNYKS